jgi:pilus assembly protein CpaB
MADWSGPAPKGAIAKAENGLSRGVVTTIFEGEPLLDGRLAPKGAGAGLAATIPVGKRAVAIRVNEIIGVAGFVVPGMRVDIIFSGTPPGAPTSLGTLSKIALQNIEVLSAGQKIEKTAEGTPQTVNVVNLLVTPEQAEVLSLASNQTSLQLVLRNPLDTEQAKTTGTATANLFSGTPFRAPVPAASPVTRRVQPPPAPKPVQEIRVERVIVPVTVEVYHGAKKAETQFKTKEENN